MSVTVKNPIMPGFYPDPSCCAVGEDFYLVNSSFAYFPGLPIMHSKDLCHWEQIGNVLTRESQIPLGDCELSRGLFAPTIRYHKGIFYVICTNVCCDGNFIVTATDPRGPWSEPHYLDGADGIDPSLFFDEDGRCYYTGTHPNPDGCKYNGDWYIYIQEVDIENFKLIGEPKNVWNGAMKGVHWPEGPHLYKIGEYYYLLHAEGGTGPEHAVSVARSTEVFGPYENNFCNPIFTHRHLGQEYPIKYVGHADLFQTVNGEWYMAMLAVRPTDGYTTMGRETFLAKVCFEKGWPVVNPGLGILSDELLVDLEEWIPDENACPVSCDRNYQFAQMDGIGYEMLMLRNPKNFLELKKGEGLYMECQDIPLNEDKAASYLGIRQDAHAFEASCVLSPKGLSGGAKAGLVYLQNNKYYLKFECEDGNGNVILCKDGVEEKLESVCLPEDTVTLLMKVSEAKASLYIGNADAVQKVVEDIDIRALSTEVAGGFVGSTIGLYASDSAKRDVPVKVLFQSFGYKRIATESC